MLFESTLCIGLGGKRTWVAIGKVLKR